LLNKPNDVKAKEGLQIAKQ